MSSVVGSAWTLGKAGEQTNALCGKCGKKIGGGEVYEEHTLGLSVHKACAVATKGFQELDREISDPEVYLMGDGSSSISQRKFSPQPEQPAATQTERLPQEGFFSRNRYKIALGTIGFIGAAYMAVKLIQSTTENYHKYCVQLEEDATQLWCCAKKVAENVASCVFERYEHINYWVSAGDPDKLPGSELPPHKDGFELSTWSVNVAQTLFRRVFGS